MTRKRFLLVGTVVGLCLGVNPVYSQIIPDRTTQTSVSFSKITSVRVKLLTIDLVIS